MYPRRLLPGIAVAVPPPAFPDALPRMDVALFVGFAERGPTHRPVAVDSVEAYAAVFGGDVVLAHGAKPVTAALAPSVRGFFSNGGTRAWVIRVARTEALERRWRGAGYAPGDVAVARTFTLGAIPGARVRASSVGSWADDVRVSARVERGAGGLRLMLRAERGGVGVVSGPFGIAPDDPDSWWNVPDDDGFYADPQSVAGPRGWLAPLGPPTAWNLAGLTDFWSEPVGADEETRTPLERDGLSRFDAELFLDPALATSTIASLGDTAARMRDIDGVPLLGLHGAFAVPGGADFAEPSMIVVPDAVQPGWAPRVPEKLTPPVNLQGEIPPRWRDHLGSCAVPDPVPSMGRPDPTRFLDCGTRLLATPVFAEIASPQPAGTVQLGWSESEPGATYVLEESGRADFAGAEEIWRGETRTHAVQIAREGSYYYRVHAERDGNISMASVTGFLVQDSAWEAVSEAHYDPEPLLEVRLALLRTCAAIGDQFALLSLPRHYGTEDAATHVDTLAARLPQNEIRALSHGALYHPWIAAPIGSTIDPDWLVVPPEGTVAGSFARRARQRGAWLAPANIPLEDMVALSPVVRDRDREDFARARVNLMRNAPIGFVATDAMTLSREYDWGEINVRRLMSLLRRVCVRRGAPFVFEPNGDTTRRAIERSFGHMLDDMVSRGAFAGEGKGDSYRLSVDASESDRMNGRLVIEIAVAPAQPLRFLTLVLAQAGERFTVAEER
ncbi:hypothetical protein FHS95_000458 [Sphingomonas naasensis]|uniref:Tail sheath protein C-terminal domain-containing protein n=1 Tax=Sphingomonas naasensis TaxID=1344951 RepID=A0A4S1WRK3_9SPHN|nr:phage tail sheath C-terminal domain-containing protein [Sphingomonas naasensis]NIJ18789.1 hypothetical protein [Sphingomonas naasensis]TGX46018.1 hypothetical protein E5A74_02260 [Sphingomonas naasensis]